MHCSNAFGTEDYSGIQTGSSYVWMLNLNSGMQKLNYYLKNSRPEVFFQKFGLKTFAKFTGERLCWSLTLMWSFTFKKVQAWIFVITPIAKNICERLRLSFTKTLFGTPSSPLIFVIRGQRDLRVCPLL